MTTKNSSKLFTIIGLLLAVGSVVSVMIIDQPLSSAQPVTFSDPAGTQLSGFYYPGTQPFGVLLLEGFGSDQVTMTSLASEFARSGWHVFTFDFSGHGRSSGTLAFDNAQTDRLAQQAISALEQFQQLSGLRPDQIFITGHSLGARVALQSAVLNPEKAAGLVLLGTQVNVSTNVQSEFFTGTTDAELPWVQALGRENPPVPIMMISGAWDDILTPANARQLYHQLAGSPVASAVVSTEGRPLRENFIEPFLVHNYEPFSPRVIRLIQIWLETHFGARFPFSPAPSIRILAWVLGLAGIYIMLLSGKQWLELAQGVAQHQSQVTISNLRKFLWSKLLLWIAALSIAALLGSVFFFIPLGKPVFNLIYVGFIGGYGLLLLALYWRERVPGVRGSLWSGRTQPGDVLSNWKRVIAALGILVGVLVLTAAYSRTGWFYVFPFNVRLVWLVIFIPLTALGFWIGLKEAHFQPKTRGIQLTLTLIGLFPFFIYTALMAAIGSLSGMIGGLQGLLILGLVLTFGSLIQAVGRRPWLTAVCMAVLLYWLILPQGVLFG